MEKIISAIKSENEEETINLIQTADAMEPEAIEILLKSASSTKMQEIIKNGFINKFGVLYDKEKIKDIPSVDDDNEEKNNSEDFNSELNEEEALIKYKFAPSKHQKAFEMFFACFKSNIESINCDKAGSISKSIVDLLVEEFSTTFPKEVRSKCHNLKENSKLCANVYYGSLSTYNFVKMSTEEMISEDLRFKDLECIRNSILESQQATVAADTDMFKCSRCKQKKCTYSQLQTRSCDEPMTTFVTCTVCGNRWKF